MIKIIIYILLISFLFSCEANLVAPEIPQDRINETISMGSLIDKEVIDKISGIYKLNENNSPFGELLVIKQINSKVSVFCGKNAAFMLLEPRLIDSQIVLAGYWRFSQSGENGFVKISISKENSSQLLNLKIPQSLILNAEYEHESKTKKISLSYNRALKTELFMVIGHRGGGRNSDRHPASENSLNMISYSERLGANGVELDVQCTKDGIPILFHDINISKRLVREDFFIGEIPEYTYAQLRSFCTLKNGEKIPSLEEALQFIIDSTNHRLVWLDIKNEGILVKIASIQSKYLEKAKLKGRDLKIYIGIPSEEIFNEFMAISSHNSIPSICELEEQKVYSAGSDIWAPRWSLGFLTDRVKAIQEDNKNVFVWTLDEPIFIRKFLDKSFFDGILTNYPTVVTYEYYTN